MATGLAGDELLETLLRSALLLWLLYYCLVSVAAIFSLQSEKGAFAITPFIAPLSLGMALVAILLNSSHTMEMFKFIVALLVASSSLATLLVFIHPRKKDLL